MAGFGDGPPACERLQVRIELALGRRLIRCMADSVVSAVVWGARNVSHTVQYCEECDTAAALAAAGWPRSCSWQRNLADVVAALIDGSSDGHSGSVLYPLKSLKAIMVRCRVDAVLPLEGRSLADVAAALIGGSSDGHSGSALYLLSSLFNHSCMPSVDVQYSDNSSR